MDAEEWARRYVELTPADLAYRWCERTLPERIAEAVAEAGDTEEYATADSALRWTLNLAWADLAEARRSALNGQWSIRCNHLVTNIIGLTQLVGPMPWEKVDVDLLLDGTYEQIHEAIGTPTPLSDDDRARARAVLDRRFTERT